MAKSVIRISQRRKLKADGYKAISLIRHKGYGIEDCLLIIGGSRARLYRAMATVDDDNVHPSGVNPDTMSDAEYMSYFNDEPHIVKDRRKDDAEYIDPLLL